MAEKLRQPWSVARDEEEDAGASTPIWLKVFEKLGAIESRLGGVETHLAEQNGSVKRHAQWIAEQKGRYAYRRVVFEGGLLFVGAALGFAGHVVGIW